MLLNKHNLAIAAFASQDATRYNLHGLHVKAGCTEATDGHRLARVTVPKDDPKDFPDVGVALNGAMPSTLVPLDAAKALAKALPKGRAAEGILANAIVDTTAAKDGTFRAVATDLQTRTPVEARAIEGAFPELDLVLPKKPPYVRVRLNARYLAEAAKVAGDLAGGRACGIDIEIPAPESSRQGGAEVFGPVVIRATNTDTGQEGVFLIMPMRR